MQVDLIVKVLIILRILQHESLLVACVVTEFPLDQSQERTLLIEIAHKLKELPSYMHPDRLYCLSRDRVPLTINGKVAFGLTVLNPSRLILSL